MVLQLLLPTNGAAVHAPVLQPANVSARAAAIVVAAAAMA